MAPSSYALACALLVALTLASIQQQRRDLEALTKTSASLAFIAYAVALGAHQAGTAGVTVLVALVLSAIGDVLLVSRDKRAFLGGLVSFLLAHVAYVVAFGALGLSASGLWVLLPLGALAYVVWRWIGPRAGKLAKPVAAYIVVISAMVLAAACALAAEVTVQRQALMAAATLFFLSDLCVARDRFVEPGLVNRVVGLPLYYGAQLLFAAAISWD